MWTGVLSVLSSLAGGVFTDWQERRRDQREVERAVVENKIRLAQSTETHNNEWEMAALAGTDKLVRRLSFMAWSAPLIWAAYDATAAAAYFSTALTALPEWYVAGYLGITGAIWGIAELKSSGILKR